MERATDAGPDRADRADLHGADGSLPELTPDAWERALFAAVFAGDDENALARDLAADPAAGLIRRLIWRFRAGAVIKSLPLLTQLLRLSGGEAMLESLLDAYFAAHPPEPFASEEGGRFLEFVRRQNLDIPFLAEVMAWESAAMRALLEQKSQTLRLQHDPRTLVEALQEGRLPASLPRADYELEITP
jgi:hypothetical protein